MKISVVVPVYNAGKIISDLIISLKRQRHSDFEVIFVNDCSTDNTEEIINKYLKHKHLEDKHLEDKHLENISNLHGRIISSVKNQGPAYCRNLGTEVANGDIIVFTDSDCVVEEDWLYNIHKAFINNIADVLMGRLIIRSSTTLGDSISALGFPAGGSIGFEKIWKVDSNGFTDSLSTCNCAILKRIFNETGGFDTSFPFPGGEDSLLAYHIRELGYKIKYSPKLIVHHAARDSLKDFIKWQFRRGISSYIFSKKIKLKKPFISLRLWSTINIIKHSYKDKKFPLIMLLFFISFILQLAGFFKVKLKPLIPKFAVNNS